MALHTQPLNEPSPSPPPATPSIPTTAHLQPSPTPSLPPLPPAHPPKPPIVMPRKTNASKPAKPLSSVPSVSEITPSTAVAQPRPRPCPSVKNPPSEKSSDIYDARDDKSNPRKPAPDSRPSKSTSNKAEKAAERAAEKAAEKAAEANALAAERANLENLLQQTETDLLNSLRQVEHDIESKEDQYIRVTWPHGNVLRGWDGFGRRVERTDKAVTGNGSGVATGAPKHRKARASDRIFSLSSSTSIFRKQNPFAVIQRPITNKKKKKR